MCKRGANLNPWAAYRMFPPPTPSLAPLVPKPGIEKYPFEVAAKGLEANENVNRAHLIRHFLTKSDVVNNRTAFTKAPNE